MKLFSSLHNICLGKVAENHSIEAATRGVLCKKVFLEISQKSWENTCARASFLIKLQACLWHGVHHYHSYSCLKDTKQCFP